MVNSLWPTKQFLYIFAASFIWKQISYFLGLKCLFMLEVSSGACQGCACYIRGSLNLWFLSNKDVSQNEHAKVRKNVHFNINEKKCPICKNFVKQCIIQHTLSHNDVYKQIYPKSCPPTTYTKLHTSIRYGYDIELSRNLY